MTRPRWTDDALTFLDPGDPIADEVVLGDRRGRVPRFQIGVRGMMIAVVVVALLLTGPPTAWRWNEYRYRHRASADMAKNFLLRAETSERTASQLRETLARVDDPAKKGRMEGNLRGIEDDARGYRELSEWAKGLVRKYDAAMGRPWVAVPFDPPFRATGNITGEPGWSTRP